MLLEQPVQAQFAQVCCSLLSGVRKQLPID
jgi:hypothetical protein